MILNLTSRNLHESLFPFLLPPPSSSSAFHFLPLSLLTDDGTCGGNLKSPPHCQTWSNSAPPQLSILGSFSAWQGSLGCWPPLMPQPDPAWLPATSGAIAGLSAAASLHCQSCWPLPLGLTWLRKLPRCVAKASLAAPSPLLNPAHLLCPPANHLR